MLSLMRGGELDRGQLCGELRHGASSVDMAEQWKPNIALLLLIVPCSK